MTSYADEFNATKQDKEAKEEKFATCDEGGSRIFESDCESTYRYEEKEYSIQDLMSDSFGLFPSDTKIEESSSCNYKNVKTIRNREEDNTVNKNDLASLPEYLLDYKESEENNFPYLIENTSDNTGNTSHRIIHDLLATTADNCYRASKRNIKAEMNEVETISQSVNEEETISPEPLIGEEMDKDSNVGKDLNLRSNSRKMKSSDERERLETQPRQKQRAANTHEIYFSDLSMQKKHLPLSMVYECWFCKLIFSSCSGFKQHSKIHGNEKHYKSKLYGFKCQRDSLKRFMTTHTEEKPFECEICAFKCSQKGNLKRHMKTHTQEKPFRCEICGYKCSEKERLKLHMRTHTQEKPFQCEICGYKCSEKGTLKVHTRTHTQEKPFKCEICGYECAINFNLKHHRRNLSNVKYADINVLKKRD